MAKITYTNKTNLITNTTIPDNNKVNASDMNEIKTVVNGLDTSVTTLNTFVSSGGTMGGALTVDGNFISNKSIHTGAKTSLSDGLTGAILSSDGGLYLSAPSSAGGIRFYYNNSSAQTARIYEVGSGILMLQATTTAVTGAFQSAGALLANGSATSNANFFSGGRTSSVDGKTGGILAAAGNLYLNSATTPSVYFQYANATSTSLYLRATATNTLYSSGNFAVDGVLTVTGTLTTAGAITTSSGVSAGTNVVTGGKTGAGDGKAGAVLANTGILYLVGTSPTINTYFNNSTTATASIKETSSGTLQLYNNVAATGSLTAGTSVFTGGRTQTSDGKTGCILTNSGNLYLCNAGAPEIRFQYGRSTATQGFTSRIYEVSAGVLSTVNLTVTGTLNNEYTNDSGWITATLENGFIIYGGNKTYAPKYRKIGKSVEIRGQVSPPEGNVLGSGDTAMTIFTLPTGYRPSMPITQICHGSSLAIWLLRIQVNGIVTAERYRTGETRSTPSTTAWMPFQATFMVD